jgi:hypothetical protein
MGILKGIIGITGVLGVTFVITAIPVALGFGGLYLATRTASGRPAGQKKT